MPNNETVTKEMHLFELWRKVWSWKFILIITSVSTGIITLIVSLFLPKVYEGKVTILAPEAATGGFAEGLIAQAAGLSQKGAVSSQTILVLLNSSAMKKTVIKEFNVVETFNIKKTETTEFIDKITSFSLDQIEGIITVKVETHSPELSAKMANFYVNYLNTLNETIKITPEKPLVKVIDWASVPTEPSKPRIKWNTAIGIFLGFVISFIILYVKETLKDYWT